MITVVRGFEFTAQHQFNAMINTNISNFLYCIVICYCCIGCKERHVQGLFSITERILIHVWPFIILINIFSMRHFNWRNRHYT